MGSAARCSYPLRGSLSFVPFGHPPQLVAEHGIALHIHRAPFSRAPQLLSLSGKGGFYSQKAARGGQSVPCLGSGASLYGKLVCGDMMSSGRQLCRVLRMLVLCSQSASSLAFLCRRCRMLAATDCSCSAWALLKPNR